MLHDLGALVVEDEQVVVGLDEVDGLAGEEPGDIKRVSAADSVRALGGHDGSDPGGPVRGNMRDLGRAFRAQRVEERRQGGEFEGDAETITDLIEVATSSPEQFAHATQRARDDRHRAAIKVEAISDLMARGYTVNGRNLRDRHAEELDHIPERRIRRIHPG